MTDTQKELDPDRFRWLSRLNNYLIAVELGTEAKLDSGYRVGRILRAVWSREAKHVSRIDIALYGGDQLSYRGFNGAQYSLDRDAYINNRARGQCCRGIVHGKEISDVDSFAKMLYDGRIMEVLPTMEYETETRTCRLCGEPRNYKHDFRFVNAARPGRYTRCDMCNQVPEDIIRGLGLMGTLTPAVVLIKERRKMNGHPPKPAPVQRLPDDDQFQEDPAQEEPTSDVPPTDELPPDAEAEAVPPTEDLFDDPAAPAEEELPPDAEAEESGEVEAEAAAQNEAPADDFGEDPPPPPMTEQLVPADVVSIPLPRLAQCHVELADESLIPALADLLEAHPELMVEAGLPDEPLWTVQCPDTTQLGLAGFGPNGQSPITATEIHLQKYITKAKGEFIAAAIPAQVMADSIQRLLLQFDTAAAPAETGHKPRQAPKSKTRPTAAAKFKVGDVVTDDRDDTGTITKIAGTDITMKTSSGTVLVDVGTIKHAKAATSSRKPSTVTAEQARKLNRPPTGYATPLGQKKPKATPAKKPVTKPTAKKPTAKKSTPKPAPAVKAGPKPGAKRITSLPPA